MKQLINNIKNIPGVVGVAIFKDDGNLAAFDFPPAYDQSLINTLGMKFQPIKEILPHRSPFLFVDRVIKLKVPEEIVAEKDLSPDDHFFAGHFPGRAIMPGVLVSEALAQTSGLLLGLTLKEEGQFGRAFVERGTR